MNIPAKAKVTITITKYESDEAAQQGQAYEVTQETQEISLLPMTYEHNHAKEQATWQIYLMKVLRRFLIS